MLDIGSSRLDLCNDVRVVVVKYMRCAQFLTVIEVLWAANGNDGNRVDAS
jgi:hypothetical protein